MNDFESGKTEGIEQERDRIIKLLKEHFDNPEGCPCVLCWNFAGTELMTALIKGENKKNLWTSRPLNEEDKEHYGQEGDNK